MALGTDDILLLAVTRFHQDKFRFQTRNEVMLTRRSEMSFAFRKLQRWTHHQNFYIFRAKRLLKWFNLFGRKVPRDD